MALVDDSTIVKPHCVHLPLSIIREIDRQSKAAGVTKTYLHRQALIHGLVITQQLLGLPAAEER